MCSACYCANELSRRADSDKWIQSPAGVTGTRVDSNSGGHLAAVGGVGGGLPALQGPHSYPQQLNHLTSQYTPASWGGGGASVEQGTPLMVNYAVSPTVFFMVLYIPLIKACKVLKQ